MKASDKAPIIDERDINKEIQYLLASSPIHPMLQGQLKQLLQKTTTLDLSNLKSDDISASLEDAMGALHENTSITRLNLENNTIGYKETKKIAKVIATNKTITTLNLRCNDIGVKGAEKIAEAMLENSTITTLYFGDNNIGDKGTEKITEAITRHNITTLDLSSNNIKADGAKYIAEAVIKTPTIQVLYLGDNDIGDKGAKEIANAVSQHNTLTTLTLGCNNIGKTGATDIAQSMLLNATINHLGLENNHIGNEGAEEIAKVITTNTIIKNLNLEGNDIGDKGVKCITDAMPKNTTITNIALENNNTQQTSPTDLKPYLKRNQDITSKQPPTKQDVIHQLQALEKKIAQYDDMLFETTKELLQTYQSPKNTLTPEQKAVLSHPKCASYYFYMNQHLNNTILAYHILDSGRAKGSSGNAAMISSAMPAVQMLLETVSPSLPGVGLVTKSVAIGLNGLDDEMQKKAQKKISNFFENLDPKTLSQSTARQMTLRYAEQIKQFGDTSTTTKELDKKTEKAIKEFAHYGVARMIKYISLSNEKKSKLPITKCIAAITNTTDFPLTGLELTALELTLSARYVHIDANPKKNAKNKIMQNTSMKKGWTEAGVHTETGLFTQAGKYFSSPDNPKIKAEKYGYTLAEEGEAHATNLTEEKSMASSAYLHNPIITQAPKDKDTIKQDLENTLKKYANNQDKTIEVAVKSLTDNNTNDAILTYLEALDNNIKKQEESFAETEQQWKSRLKTLKTTIKQRNAKDTKIEQEQQAILSNPALRTYYHNTCRRITHLFIGYRAMASGVLTPNIDASNSIPTQSLPIIAELLEVAGYSFPFAGLAAKAVAHTLTKIAQELQKQENKHIAEFLGTTDPQEAGENIARRLTLRYNAQIKALGAAEGSKKADKKTNETIAEFAKCSVARILEYMVLPDKSECKQQVLQITGQQAGSKNRNIETELVLGPRYLNLKQGLIGNFTLRHKEGLVWTEEGVHTRTGLLTENRKYFASTNNKKTRVEKYGYALATEKEAIASGLIEEKNMGSSTYLHTPIIPQPPKEKDTIKQDLNNILQQYTNSNDKDKGNKEIATHLTNNNTKDHILTYLEALDEQVQKQEKLFAEKEQQWKAQLQDLEAKANAKRQKPESIKTNQERLAILSDPILRAYYHHTQRRTTHLFMGYCAMDSKVLTPNASTSTNIATRSLPMIAELLEAAGYSFPFVAGASKAAALGLTELAKQLHKQENKHIINFLNTVDPQEAGENIARQMTLRYYTQIKELGVAEESKTAEKKTNETIAKFAKYSVARMLEYMVLPDKSECKQRALKITDSRIDGRDIATELVLGTRYVNLKQGLIGNASLKHKGGLSWTEAGVHKHSGLKLLNGTCYAPIPDPDVKTKINVDKYGYIVAWNIKEITVTDCRMEIVSNSFQSPSTTPPSYIENTNRFLNANNASLVDEEKKEQKKKKLNFLGKKSANQIAALKKENADLKTENTALKKENTTLKEENTGFVEKLSKVKDLHNACNAIL